MVICRIEFEIVYPTQSEVIFGSVVYIRIIRIAGAIWSKIAYNPTSKAIIQKLAKKFQARFLDDSGNIKTDDRLRTSVPGIFAAGDVRNTHLRQVATAVGDGALAAISAHDFLIGKR